MTLKLIRLSLLSFSLAWLPLQAHEFWIAPLTTSLAEGDKASLSLWVGQYFTGVLVGFSKPQTVALRQYTAAGEKDLSPLLPPAPVAAIEVPVERAGTHLFRFDSDPHTIVLESGLFHAYLHDEGLDFINDSREAAGTSSTPGRERYRRFVKTLVRVEKSGGVGSTDSANSAKSVPKAKPDSTYATVTGQRLEIVPLNDPLALLPGKDLGVRVLFEGKALPGALLKAWYKHGEQTVIVRAKTRPDGTASFNLPYAGPWMINVVHMIPAVGEPELDWDSLWGNLSFVVASAARKN